MKPREEKGGFSCKYTITFRLGNQYLLTPQEKPDSSMAGLDGEVKMGKKKTGAVLFYWRTMVRQSTGGCKT